MVSIYDVIWIFFFAVCIGLAAAEALKSINSKTIPTNWAKERVKERPPDRDQKSLIKEERNDAG